MLLSELINDVNVLEVKNYRDLEVSGLSYDSRLVKPGEAFFCIEGIKTDGHLYIKEAVKRGAEVVFTQKVSYEDIPENVTEIRVADSRLALAQCACAFYSNPSRDLFLVGVTGTNGKTTTCFLVEKILAHMGMKTGVIGTIENHIGSRIEPVTRTTPESLDLQKLLRRMVDEEVEATAMEVSSHALELERVKGCEFDVVVFTNLTQDHLDFHLSIEEYFSAKSSLFTEAGYGEERKAIINIDDDFGMRIFKESNLSSMTYGIERDADIMARDVSVLPAGNRFVLEWPGGEVAVESKLKGKFNVYNCLAAAGASLQAGAKKEDIKLALEEVEGIPGRFESIRCGQPFEVVVDYAHTPEGVRGLLETSRQVCGGKVILVVGCGGDRDRSKRPLMGKIGVEMSDFCIFTSDNPRSEEPTAIIEMMLESVRGKFPSSRYAVEVDRRKAIHEAIEEANPGDIVVIAGKGHEKEQLVGNKAIPFDDREVARDCLKEVMGAKA